MTRAALFGAVMGLLLGGAILAVLALRLSVVDMPGESRAVAGTDAPDSIASDAGARDGETSDPGSATAPSTSDRVVSPAVGPDATAPDQIARLTDSVGARQVPDMPQTSRSGPPEAPSLSGLAEMVPSAERPSAVAGLLAVPPEDASAIRGFRTLAASSRHALVGWTKPDWQTQAQRSVPAAVAERAGPVLTLESSVLVGDLVTAAPVPGRLSAFDASSSSVPLGAPFPTSHSSAIQTASTQVVLIPAPRNGPGLAAPRTATEGAAPKLTTESAAPKAEPARRTGAERSPMILWLVTDLPAGTTAPDWAVVSDVPDGVAPVPPLDQPEALAGFAAGLSGDNAPGAVILQRGRDWPAVLLAPVLNLAPLQQMPVLYPGGVPPETVALLQARAPRSMPVYDGIDAELPRASVDAALAAVGARARRDGLVVVQLRAEPALLEAVATWRSGPGADLGAARLTDLFGG